MDKFPTAVSILLILSGLTMPVRAELADDARSLQASADEALKSGSVESAVKSLGEIIELYKKSGIDLCSNGYPLEAAFRIGELRGFTKDGAAQYKAIADKCGDRNARQRQEEIEFFLGTPEELRKLYAQAKEYSREIERTGGTPELQSRRLDLLGQIITQFPKSRAVPLVLYTRASVAVSLRHNAYNPLGDSGTDRLARQDLEKLLRDWPASVCPIDTVIMKRGEVFAPYASFLLAEVVGTPSAYEEVIKRFPNSVDFRSGGIFPENPKVRFATNARVHLLNAYSDWEQRGAPRDLPKARAIAEELIKLPNELFVVDWYVGYTHPHALLFLASLQTPEHSAETYLGIIRDYGHQITGKASSDAGGPYWGLAAQRLRGILPALSVGSPLRPKIEGELRRLSTSIPTGENH